MYTFPDRDGTSLTLRPEGTAGTVRAFIEHNRAADPLPQKYFYIGPMFRHERPQAGRLRQFHQFGVESFGTSDPRADVEVMALLWRLLSDLALPDLTLEINSLGSFDDRAAYKPILLAFLKQQESQLCANFDADGHKSLEGAGLQGAGLSGCNRIGAKADRPPLS
jgi:histidyl-tRNA synthetase